MERNPKDIASGTDPKVAVGSEVASVAVSAMIAGALAGLAGALIAIEGPAAVATIAINIGVSTLLDTLGLKGEAAKLINDALAGAEKHISAAGEPPRRQRHHLMKAIIRHLQQTLRLARRRKARYRLSMMTLRFFPIISFIWL
ncbi:hypothetical protein WJ969_19185 [Achromobacter xylosoxidans]